MADFNQYITEPLLNSIRNHPDRSAFFIHGKNHSYLEFAGRISAIRSAIAEDREEKIYALAIQDNLDTYASILALWLEGKAYVPLHPLQPVERNLNIIEQLGCTHVIETSARSPFSEFKEVSGKPVSLIRTCDIGEPAGPLCLEPREGVSGDELAYILFTSGSTGVPKGVQLTRNNIASFMDSFWKTGISIDETDRCLQVFDLTFDVSIQSYLVALTRGACCYTVPYGQVKYLYAAGLIQKQGITFGAMAPSMLTYLRPYFGEFDASSMKTCILTAEACPVDLMEEWYKCAKNTELYDFYGPTEATVYCTFYKLTRGGRNLSLNGIISIGLPMANVKAVIIDENGAAVPENSGAGHKGELCVAGAQVTPGYWNNPEKNASSFFVMDGERYYHTGDLCYWDESGNIMYSGRIDQQAKIQGFRVELGEIEYHAREFFKKEKRVMAIAFQNDKNLTEIALFIESEETGADDLTAYLRSKMPSYMIPSRFIFLPEFPLNKSEKVDRNALKNQI